MDRGDCLRVAIGILFLMVVFKQVIGPEKYEKRIEFMRFVYSASEDQQRLIIDQLWNNPVHNQWKNCKDIVMPVCKEIRETPNVRDSVRMFCKDLWDYCKRYEPNIDNVPEY